MNFKKKFKDITHITKVTRDSGDALRKATSITKRISIEKGFCNFSANIAKIYQVREIRQTRQQLHMVSFMLRSNLHKVETRKICMG